MQFYFYVLRRYSTLFHAVLKFSEVYFNAPGQKVFDVVLNNDHSIVSDLDIYSNVGHGVAHDEMIPFTIADGMLKVQVNALESKGRSKHRTLPNCLTSRFIAFTSGKCRLGRLHLTYIGNRRNIANQILSGVEIYSTKK